MSGSVHSIPIHTAGSAPIHLALETIAVGEVGGEFARIVIGQEPNHSEKTIVKLKDTDVNYIRNLLQNIPEAAQKGTILTLAPCGRIYDKGNQFKITSIEMSDAVLEIIKTVKPSYYGVFTSAISDFGLLVRRAGAKQHALGNIRQIESVFTPQQQAPLLDMIRADQSSHSSNSAVDQLIFTAHQVSLMPLPR